jgi:RNA polymerase sigma-70 factor, ECF subfamily
MESIGNKRREEEFGRILENYAQFLNIHVRKYDLQKYGLDPEDILQDVRIKLWKLINDEKMIFSPGSYLKKVIASSVVDHLRKARREDVLLRHEKQKHIAEIGHSYSKEAARKRMFEETVGRAVSRLIHSRRQVVKLYLLNFSVQDISSYMNWSVDKTRNLLYRGLADLRKSLKDLETRDEIRK